MAHIRKRKTNVYQIIVYLGRGEQKKKQYYETFYGSKTEAKYRAIALEKKLKKQKTGPKCNVQNISDLLLKWLEDSKEGMGHQTYRSYQSKVKKLIPLVGT